MKTQFKHLVLLALIAGACEDNTAVEVDQTIQQVVITAAATEVEAGQTVEVNAVAKQADGTARPDVAISWTVSDTTVASITGTTAAKATILGKQGGTVTVQAKAEQKSAAVQISVKAPAQPNPAPGLVALEPAFGHEGTTGGIVRLKGRDFVPATYVEWNGVRRLTAFVSATELRVEVTPQDAAIVGDATVRVVTPGPGGGATTPLFFTIYGKPVALTLTGPALPDVFLTGEVMQLGIVATDTRGRTIPDVHATWSSSWLGSATVDQSGKVSMVGPGQSVIRASVDTMKRELVVNIAAAPAADVIYDATEDGVRQLFISRPGVPGRSKVFAGVVPARQPAPSPDGSRIAFVGEGTNGNAEIFVADRNGTGIRQLTLHGLTDDQPVWSPDGLRIAFRSQRNLGYNDIWIINADGTGLQQLTNDEVRVNMTGYEHPAWSPDGKHIVYQMTDYGMAPRRFVLMKHEIATGRRTMIVNDPSLSDAEPAYGTRNDMIAIRRTFKNELGDQIQFINPIDGQTWLYIDYPGAGRNPAISPDNTWLAFESAPANAPNASGIYLNWIGTWYRRVIGAGNAAGSPANPRWIRR